MLDVAVQFLKEELNTFLLTRTGSSTVTVKLSKIVDEAGKYALDINTIGVALLNIEEERIFRAQIPEYSTVNGQHLVQEPEMKLNLHLLFAAHFQLYDQALKYISYVLTYFQSHPSFTSVAYPALDSRIGKLVVELQSLSYEQLNQVWAFIGGKQLPSVLYKVRMVVLQDEAKTAIQPPVMIVNSQVRSR
jgi:hypothetical protein